MVKIAILLFTFFTSISVSAQTTCIYSYGSGCGASGALSVCRVAMLKMVTEKDTTLLNKWLFSEDNEEVAYAVEGYALLRNSIVIAPEILNRINSLKEDNTEVITCSGCSHERTQLYKIVYGWGF